MFELMLHQIDAISRMGNGKVLIGDVGSGKSITALEYYTQNAHERPIIVLTTAKKRDSGEWYADAMKMSLRADLSVDSWNNIKKYENVENANFIFDEQRLVGSGAWVKSFYKIASKNNWIVLSATPADTWMDLVPIFIANGFFRNKSEFNTLHVKFARYAKYPKVEGYYDTDILKRLRDQIFVAMPHVKTTIREEHTLKVGFDKEQQSRIIKDRWHIFEDRPIKDAGEMFRLLRTTGNTHPSRYEQIKYLAKEHPRLMIFYNLDVELELLRGLSEDLDIPIAEWNGHKHQTIPDGDRWIYLVQYQAGNEGWNCITTDAMAFFSLPYSYKQYKQARGRIDRLNTPFPVLKYYTLRADSVSDRSVWYSLRQKKKFQEGAFAKRLWKRSF